MRRFWYALLGGLAIASPAPAQENGLAAPCSQLQDEQARTTCYAVAQAAESAQPQLGVLIAGGNPVLGAASPLGLRFGTTPRIDISTRANLVFVRLPDVLAAEAGERVQQLNERLGIPAPALGANVAIGALSGFTVAPGVGGIGSVDLLGSATWLPFRALRTQGFEAEAPDVAWGVGARVGLLRESFTMPGVSVSVMYHDLGRVAFGNVCRGEEFVDRCIGGGDAGEFAFDLRNWSTRAVVGKRFLGVGLTAGAGYDTYASDVDYGFRYPDLLPGDVVVRQEDIDLRSTRWSAFGNLSYTFLLTTVALEAGWQQGDTPIPGFAPEARFDPRRGSFFGSAGVRISF